MTVPATASYLHIPYGETSFPRIRRNGWLYVDKTRFLRPLEDERYVFFIRPRRFGKSCWLSLLECYYGRHWAHEFEDLFGGTDIGRAPTAERGRYVVVRFDFSASRSKPGAGFDDKPETLEGRFQEYCFIDLRHALVQHPDLFPEPALRRILAPPAIDGRLQELFHYAGERDIPLYFLIDEYDHFANTALADWSSRGQAHRGREASEPFIRSGGFHRNFFAALKAGAGGAGGGLERLFITGVSPITMDDVTSGFNIARNVSLERKFNEVLGFTEPEVRGLLERYRDRGAFDQDVDAALDVMREWCDGYRFSEDAANDLYNTDMVLHYLKDSVPNKPMPRRLIDPDMRIDYPKLRPLLLVNRQASAEARRLNDNFDLLRHVIGEGEAEAGLILSFPLDRLDEPENFLSLLYYFGLLSIRGVFRGATRLGIPNQTVRRLMYGYLRDAYRDVGVFSVSQHHFSGLVGRMAYEGEWRPAVEYIATAIAEQTGVRDYIDGEKAVQAFLAAHFSVVDQFLIHSERELNKGYADLHLEPFVAQYPEIGYGYVVEVKYLKRSERVDGPVVAEKLREAREQLAGYLADEGLRRRAPSVRYVGLAVVFHGWELAACEAVEPGSGDEARSQPAPPGAPGKAQDPR